MFAVRQSSILCYSAAVILIVLLLATFSSNNAVSRAASRGSRTPDVLNSTLGFEKILVISMPERHDKRDAMSLSASVSGIDFEWMPGGDGASMSAKSKPPKIMTLLSAFSKLEVSLENDNNTLGCWRGHMNVMQRIVKERIQSALILEDDADWDVNIRKQLFEFAKGARYIQDQSERTAPRSPYGADWDLLWLGHCGIAGYVEDQRTYVIRDDPTAVPPELYFRGIRPNLSPPSISGRYNRVVYRGGVGRCAYAYAMSLEGARKLLAIETGMGEYALPADRGTARLCSITKYNGRCLTTWPTLFSSHRAAGPVSKDSDRQDIKGKWREVGETNEVVFSTRLNMNDIIISDGLQPQVIKSQWPDKTMLPEYSGDLAYPQGQGVFVKKEEFVVPPAA
ncbi:Putative glycosyl transferase, family 25 [Septoria linicola]|uniref:Glycosyl transferase, family 25 n=1 Tax=Septoria linicola TaxID=215465 RepID=A0A9Q9AZQ2_9PEZI|nr:Putative glycosyl transferase, family 25 [Septoria linicola]